MEKGHKKVLHISHETYHLSPGASQVVQLREKEVALFNVAGQLFALDNRCPHREGPLSRGQVESVAVPHLQPTPHGAEEGEGRTLAVRCPLHGWLFDLKSGRCLNQPGASTVAYNVTCKNGKMVFRARSTSAGAH